MSKVPGSEPGIPVVQFRAGEDGTWAVGKSVTMLAFQLIFLVAEAFGLKREGELDSPAFVKHKSGTPFGLLPSLLFGIIYLWPGLYSGKPGCAGA